VGKATQDLLYHPMAPPAPPPVVPPPPPPPLPDKLVGPRWELGATSGARYSGDFSGVGVAVEYRRKVRGGHWHLGVDVLGVYADGRTPSNDVRLGGVGARAVAEVRLALGKHVAGLLSGAVGAVYLYEERTPLIGSSRSVSDGTLSLALGAGLLARAGRGLVVLRLEFAWTPLIRLGLANLDGGLLSVGYRYGRW